MGHIEATCSSSRMHAVRPVSSLLLRTCALRGEGVVVETQAEPEQRQGCLSAHRRWALGSVELCILALLCQTFHRSNVAITQATALVVIYRNVCVTCRWVGSGSW